MSTAPKSDNQSKDNQSKDNQSKDNQSKDNQSKDNQSNDDQPKSDKQKKNKTKRSKRRQARVVAMQALYQWQCNPGGLSYLLTQFLLEHGANADKPYCERLISGVVSKLTEIDAILTPVLDRPLDKVSRIELSVLRVATFELSELPEVPYKVVINEAIELSKEYGADGSKAYINAVLDRLAPKLRPLEFKK